MWRKSSYSNPSGNCPEWQAVSGTVQLHDSKEKDVPAGERVVLTFTQDEWQDGNGVRFITYGSIMDISPAMRRLALMRVTLDRDLDPTQTWYEVTKDGQSLYFLQSEKDAWEKGVVAGEMTPAAA